MKVLIKYYDDDCWCEENDLAEGFRLIDSSEWEKNKIILEKLSLPIFISLGYRQVRYENGNELLKKLRVLVISDEDAIVISKYFCDGYGDYTFLDDLEWLLEEQEQNENLLRTSQISTENS